MENDQTQSAQNTIHADASAQSTSEAKPNENENADSKGEAKGNEQETNANANAEANSQEPTKFELKLDEKAELNKAYLEKVEAYAKENKLSNEQAQTILNLQNEAIKTYIDDQMESLKATQTQWDEQVKNDKEVGGANYEVSAEFAKRALGRFAEPSFIEMLDKNGFGKHPELYRTFVRIGKAMSDDSFVNPGAQSTGMKKSHAEILYGSN